MENYNKDSSTERTESCTAIITVRSKDGQVLMGRRKDSGKWSFIGGGLDNGESRSACISREVLEEVGISILPEHFKFISKTDVGNNHDVSLFIADLNELPPVILGEDIDDEFNEVRMFHKEALISDVVNLHIPANVNVAVKHLKSESRCDGVELDSIIADAVTGLSRIEKIKIQSSVLKAFDELKVVGRVEKIGIQKKIMAWLAELDGSGIDGLPEKQDESIGDESARISSGIELLNEAKSKFADIKKSKELSVSDFSFFTAEVNEELQRLIDDDGIIDAKEFLDDLVDFIDGIDSQVMLDSIAVIKESLDGGAMIDEVTMDSIEATKFMDLMTIAFDPETPDGQADRKKKQDAVAKLSAMIKANKKLLSSMTTSVK